MPVWPIVLNPVHSLSEIGIQGPRGSRLSQEYMVRSHSKAGSRNKSSGAQVWVFSHHMVLAWRLKISLYPWEFAKCPIRNFALQNLFISLNKRRPLLVCWDDSERDKYLCQIVKIGRYLRESPECYTMGPKRDEFRKLLGKDLSLLTTYASKSWPWKNMNLCQDIEDSFHRLKSIFFQFLTLWHWTSYLSFFSVSFSLYIK